MGFIIKLINFLIAFLKLLLALISLLTYYSGHKIVAIEFTILGAVDGLHLFGLNNNKPVGTESTRDIKYTHISVSFLH
jgi:hypothetical protein